MGLSAYTIMVLNNSGNMEAGSGFEDTPPQSDNDRYDELSQSGGVHKYNGEPLPRTFLGLNDDALPRLISITINRAQKELGRSPTEEEATALAYWSAKRLSVASYGSPIGASLGMIQAYRTASSFRFPFFKPDLEAFNPKAFPGPKFSIVTGMRAVYSWHAMRAMSYCGFGGLVGITIFASYAASVATVGTFKDPRLKDYVEGVKEAARRNARGVAPSPPQNPVISDRPKTPTGHKVAAEGNGSSAIDTYWGTSDNRPSADVPQESQIPTSTAIRTARPVSTQPPRATETGTSYGSAGFDDASPTGGIGVAGDVASTETAWERIRRQNASGANSQQNSSWQSRRLPPSNDTAQNSWGNGPASTSSTSYKSPTGQISEREAAQREFDEQVERERQGGSFNGSV